MRLFISYARVDKPYCTQIVDILDVHEVWYDQRIHAGQQWWEEIQQRINAAEGFVYLLSPDSVASEYCHKEFDLAVASGKHIFPVLIHPRVKLPEWLDHIQYADFTRGITMEAVKMLLNSIYIAEREGVRQPAQVASKTATSVVAPPDVNPFTVIDEVATALDCSQYDRAVFLLKQVRESGYKPRYINIEAVLLEAEAALEKQAYLREADREYKPIVALVKHTRTRKVGCEAFMSFRKSFPDYDPEGIANVCTQTLMPLFSWCDVSAGEVQISYEKKKVVYHVDAFQMSKYPITNEQFQVFINDKEGYANPCWWNFSDEAITWRRLNPEPLPTRFAWGDHPRTNICWYEAMAFCKWLSSRIGVEITLPTEQQWQRAAQGDDERLYPWGNRFSKAYCNTKENKQKMTSSVNHYEENMSPFGVHDMVGNVWEWCNSTNTNQSRDGKTLRVVKGGSFISVSQRARTTFRFYLNPLYQYATIGFRIVATL